MASKGQCENTDHPAEPPAAPVQSTRKWQWGAILSAVKDQLPSLESDASTSDCESDGELFIFQREQPNLIPDLSEELMEFSLEDSNMQQTQKTEGHLWETWNGDLESLGFQKKTDEAQVIARDIQMVKDETSNLASPTEEIPRQKEESRVLEESLADSTDHLEEEELGREQARERGNSWLNATWSVEELGSPKERRKLIETKILSKLILEPSPGHPDLAVKPPSHNISNSPERSAKEKETSLDGQEMTHLSLENIEKWDLDKILEDMEQQKDNIPAEAAFSSETFRSRSEKELMEKLEELCARQSRTVSPCCRWPSAKLFSSQEQQEKDVALLSSSRSSLRMDTMRLQCLLEPVTVYIDLRDAKPQKSVTFHDEDQSASDSSAEEKETMTIEDQAERTRRSCSGKSLLLQQLRTAQKEAPELLCKMPALPEKLEGIKQDPGSLEEIGSPKINQTKSLKVRQETNKVIPRKLARLKPEKREIPFSSCGDSGADIENKMEAEKIQNAGNAPESPLTATELPRTEESKNKLSQKEEQMKERHRRHSFQEQLERLQPQQSVTGKQPMAERTPVLFHMIHNLSMLDTQNAIGAIVSLVQKCINRETIQTMNINRTLLLEASYLPDIDTLPRSHSMKNEVLLMTIWLSSCGQVATDGCGEQVPDMVLRAANIYLALVTWLLSLVPPMERKDDPKAPFQVVGLQQAWREGGLALYACLMPADESAAQKSTKIQEIKTEEDLQGTSTFYQKISSFLAFTWLPDVIWWRAELVNCFQHQKCPLLPEIPSVLLSYVTAVNPDPQCLKVTEIRICLPEQIRKRIIDKKKNSYKWEVMAMPVLPALPDHGNVDGEDVDAAVEKVFVVPTGFYWQTVETDEEYFPNSSTIETCRDADTEVAMVLLFETLLQSPLATHHMLQLVLASGLDICGLRLLYPQQDVLRSSSGRTAEELSLLFLWDYLLDPNYTDSRHGEKFTKEKLPSSYTSKTGKVPPVLALGVRGPKARSTLQSIVGPSDPRLASVTDCGSINAIYCRSHEEPLILLPLRDSRVHRELCLWFGGRAAAAALQAGGLNMASSGDSRASSQSPSSTRAEADKEKVDVQGVVLSRSPAMLVSTTKGDIILVVSPVVSPHAYGNVIAVCTRRGFVLQGIRRLQLSPEQAAVLSMMTSQIAVFCPSKISSSPDSPARGELSAEPRVHCLILLLRKENARHHIAALVKGLIDELARQGLLGNGQSSLPAAAGLDPTNCFHAAPYTETLLQALGGNLSTVPDPRNIPLDLFCNQAYVSDPEMEQVVILTVVGMDAVKSAGELLHQLLLPECNHEPWNAEGPDSGFELLGLKWLPHLTRCQAREVTPFEVGEASWRSSLDVLMSSPVLVCALRRINAFTVLADALKRLTPCREKESTSGSRLQTVMAMTPEVTFRQAILFFTEMDFVTDAEHRPAMKYLPPPGRSRAEGERRSCPAESLLTHLTQGAQILCTVLLIKPGAWSHSLARILRKLDLEKFTVVGMKHINLEPDVASRLLSSEVKQDSAALEAHCTYLTSGTALVLCLQRPNAVKKLIDLLGPEDPKLAQALDPFLWRAQYGISTVQNGFYGSKSYQIAVRDMKLFFPEGLCCAECQTLEEEEIHNLNRDPIITLGINKKHKIIKHETGEQLSLLGSEQPCSFDQPLLDNLCQTTCLVLPGLILRGSEHPPYVELLDQLIGKGFTVTGARLTVLDAPQAHCISETLIRAKCSVAAKCSLLMDGLCLLLAVQRDNAVICFDSLLDSICWQKQSVLDTVQHLLYPQNTNQAEELLCCLFDSLTSESIHRIEPQDH